MNGNSLAFDEVTDGEFVKRFPRPSPMKKLVTKISRFGMIGIDRYSYRRANLVQQFAPLVQGRIGPKTHIMMAESCDWVCRDMRQINLDFIDLVVDWLAAGAKLDIKFFHVLPGTIACIMISIDGNVRKRNLNPEDHFDRLSMKQITLPEASVRDECRAKSPCAISDTAHYVIVTNRQPNEARNGVDLAKSATAMWIEGYHPKGEATVEPEAQLCEFVPWQRADDPRANTFRRLWNRLPVAP